MLAVEFERCREIVIRVLIKWKARIEKLLPLKKDESKCRMTVRRVANGE